MEQPTTTSEPIPRIGHHDSQHLRLVTMATNPMIGSPGHSHQSFLTLKLVNRDAGSPVQHSDISLLRGLGKMPINEGRVRDVTTTASISCTEGSVGTSCW
eukprot:sb/3478696/